MSKGLPFQRFTRSMSLGDHFDRGGRHRINKNKALQGLGINDQAKIANVVIITIYLVRRLL